MLFNIDKCRDMHIGSRDTNSACTMQVIPLWTVDEESNLVIIISTELKPTQNCKAACKKDNTLGLTASTFVCKTPEAMFPVYNSLARPHLEYAIQF